MQDVILALLAKGPVSRIRAAAAAPGRTGSVGRGVQRGPGVRHPDPTGAQRLGPSPPRWGRRCVPDRKVYELTAAGTERVAAWVVEVDWPKPAWPSSISS